MVALTSVVLAACSDHGAVKSDAPSPQASTSTTKVAPPPLVSARAGETAVLPPGHPTVEGAAAQAPMLPPVPEGAGVGDAALAWTVPSGWIVEKPTSPLRRAQYKVPGSAGDGECVVFYFGPGQGGDPTSNAQRWGDQFTQDDGSPGSGSMKISTIDVGGLQVFLVEVAGTYKGGMTMTAAPAVAKPGYRLLGAVAPGPDANWYFKFTGPDKTVSDQREAFTLMVRSLKHGAS